MVAYFRFQNNLLMALGAVLGLGAAVCCRGFLPQDLPGYILAFLAALAAFAGVVAGRIVSFFAAGRRRKALLDSFCSVFGIFLLQSALQREQRQRGYRISVLLI